MYGSGKGNMPPNRGEQQSPLPPTSSSFRPNPSANEFAPKRRAPRPPPLLIPNSNAHHRGPSAFQGYSPALSTIVSRGSSSAGSGARPATSTTATSLHSSLASTEFTPAQLTFSAALPPKPDWATTMAQQYPNEKHQSQGELTAHYDEVMGLGVKISGAKYNVQDGAATLEPQGDQSFKSQPSPDVNAGANLNANSFPLMQRPFGAARDYADQPRLVPQPDVQQYREDLFRERYPAAQRATDQTQTDTSTDDEPTSPTESEPISEHYSVTQPHLVGAPVPVWEEKCARNTLDDKIVRGTRIMHEAFPGALVTLRNLNPEKYQMPYGTRVISIRTENVRDIIFSIRNGVWSEKESVRKRIMKVWEARMDATERVLFLFSVNGSRHFCGLAKLDTPLWDSGSVDGWGTEDCTGHFSVTWIFVKTVPYTLFTHIKHDNGQPITNMWCGQHMRHESGRRVIAIMAAAPTVTNIMAWADGEQQLPINPRLSPGQYGRYSANDGGSGRGGGVDKRYRLCHNGSSDSTPFPGGGGGMVRGRYPTNPTQAARTDHQRFREPWRQQKQIGFVEEIDDAPTPSTNGRRGLAGRNNRIESAAFNTTDSQATTPLHAKATVTFIRNDDGTIGGEVPSPTAQGFTPTQHGHGYAGGDQNNSQRMPSRENFTLQLPMAPWQQNPRSTNIPQPGSFNSVRGRGNMRARARGGMAGGRGYLHAAKSWNTSNQMRENLQPQSSGRNFPRRPSPLKPANSFAAFQQPHQAQSFSASPMRGQVQDQPCSAPSHQQQFMAPQVSARPLNHAASFAAFKSPNQVQPFAGTQDYGHLQPYSAPSHQQSYGSLAAYNPHSESNGERESPAAKQAKWRAEYHRAMAVKADAEAKLASLGVSEDELSITTPSLAPSRPQSAQSGDPVSTSSIEDFNVSPVRNKAGRVLASISRNLSPDSAHLRTHRPRFSGFSESFDKRITKDMNALLASPEHGAISRNSSLSAQFHRSPTASNKGSPRSSVASQLDYYDDGGVNYGEVNDGSGGCRLDS